MKSDKIMNKKTENNGLNIVIGLMRIINTKLNKNEAKINKNSLNSLYTKLLLTIFLSYSPSLK